MEKSIALVGGGGFIGTNLANYFWEQGFNVLIIGRSAVNETRLLSKEIKVDLLDVNHTSKLNEAVQNYENIVWLANNLVPSITMDSLVDDYNFNVSPVVKFIESTTELRSLKRFIFLSSGGTIYGDSLQAKKITEENQKSPISPYGLSKIISEHYIQFLTKDKNFDSYLLRPSNVYGNFQNLLKPQGIIGYAFNAILENKAIDLYDDGKVIRDFLHVNDLASAIKKCILQPNVGKSTQIYNVGAEIGYSIKEVLTLIEKVSGKKIQVIAKPKRNFDCDYNVLDCAKIKNDLHWKPVVDLEEGLKLVWEWVKCH